MNIWVNGCFDILHTGHVELLKFAKNVECPTGENHLYVGIDSDRRVKELKGNDRPLNNEQFRKRMLESIRYVDAVTIYDSEDDMCSAIQFYDIDLMVVGDEYKDKKVLCREHSKLDVIFFPKDNTSTTNIIKKIKNS